MKDYIDTATIVGKIDTTELTRKFLGLSYPAPDGSLRPFDLYLPNEGQGPFPVVVSVSGGGWYFGHPSSEHLGRTIHNAVAAGYAVASLSCTSSGEQKFPYQIHELHGALQYLKDNRDTWNLDMDFVALWSSSSGGHLSLMTALTAAEPYFDSKVSGVKNDSRRVQAVVAIYPITEVGSKAARFTELGIVPAFDRSGPRCMDSLFLGCPVEHNPDRCLYASPISHITSNAPPLMLLHGTADKVVPYTASVEFAQRYRQIAGEDKLLFKLIDGAGHSDFRFKNDEMCGEILNFLDKIRTAASS